MKDLKTLTDRELADYMAGFKPGVAEHILCMEEFKRRGGESTARRSWIAIWISLAALVIAALSYLK